VPVESILKAHTWLPDGALASGVQNCGRERAGGMYTAVAQDVRMEILVRFSHFDCAGRSLRLFIDLMINCTVKSFALQAVLLP
jgi:hypothetical protein